MALVATHHSVLREEEQVRLLEASGQGLRGSVDGDDLFADTRFEMVLVKVGLEKLIPTCMTLYRSIKQWLIQT